MAFESVAAYQRVISIFGESDDNMKHHQYQPSEMLNKYLAKIIENKCSK